jgi:hypothetical protein
MHLTKLLLLAAFVTFASLALMQVSGLAPAGPVSANIKSIRAESDFLLTGDSMKVWVEVNTTTANVTIEVTGGDDALLTVLDCKPEACGDEGNSGESVNIGKNGVEQITLSLTARCDDGDTVLVISASVSSFAPKQEEVECRGPNLGITNIAPGAAATDKFDYTVTATGSHDCEGEFQLVHEGVWGRNCPKEVEFTITQAVPAGWTLSRIDCDRGGGLMADHLVVDRENRRVKVTFSDESDRLECTFRNAKTGGTTGTPTAANRVTVTAASSSLTCGGTSAITAVLRNASDQPVSGATVVFTATAGTLNPSSATTNASGAANSVFTPPATGGSVTITATSGTASGTRSINVTCESSAPTPTTAVPAAIPTLSAVSSSDAGGSIIRPPSTGDGGVSK